MNTPDSKVSDRNIRSAEVLSRLNDIGAINLDVLVSKSAEVKNIVGLAGLEPDDLICYPFYIRGYVRDFVFEGR